MADKTFGVKVSEELYDKVKMMIDASGISAKEWFEKAVALTEMNEIKQGATEYRQDLSELEVHTTRIYELVSNMIQRSIFIKDHAVKEISDKLEQKEAIIGEYQKKAADAAEEAKIVKQKNEELEKEKEDLIKQLEEARSVNANNQLLIDEYKEKNDALSGLVSKYQAFADENEELKTAFDKEKKEMQAAFAEEKEQLRMQVEELSVKAKNQENEIKDLKQLVNSMKREHAIEIERLTERKDFEKERAVLEAERNYQEKLLRANEEYNEKIRSLYDELANARKEYEDRIRMLESELRDQQTKEKEDE